MPLAQPLPEYAPKHLVSGWNGVCYATWNAAVGSDVRPLPGAARRLHEPALADSPTLKNKSPPKRAYTDEAALADQGYVFGIPHSLAHSDHWSCIGLLG